MQKSPLWKGLAGVSGAGRLLAGRVELRERIDDHHPRLWLDRIPTPNPRSHGLFLRRREPGDLECRLVEVAAGQLDRGVAPVGNDIAAILRRMQPRWQRYRGVLRSDLADLGVGVGPIPSPVAVRPEVGLLGPFRELLRGGGVGARGARGGGDREGRVRLLGQGGLDGAPLPVAGAGVDVGPAREQERLAVEEDLDARVARRARRAVGAALMSGQVSQWGEAGAEGARTRTP